MSSKGIEPLTAINQFFYRESPLPIGSPALILFFVQLIYYYFNNKTYTKTLGFEPRTFPLKEGHSTNRVLFSIHFFFNLIIKLNWVDQSRTDIKHYQKMVFFQIKLRLIYVYFSYMIVRLLKIIHI